MIGKLEHLPGWKLASGRGGHTMERPRALDGVSLRSDSSISQISSVVSDGSASIVSSNDSPHDSLVEKLML